MRCVILSNSAPGTCLITLTVPAQRGPIKCKHCPIRRDFARSTFVSLFACSVLNLSKSIYSCFTSINAFTMNTGMCFNSMRVYTPAVSFHSVNFLIVERFLCQGASVQITFFSVNIYWFSWLVWIHVSHFYISRRIWFLFTMRICW